MTFKGILINPGGDDTARKALTSCLSINEFPLFVRD